jgi:hypothetical protein
MRATYWFVMKNLMLSLSKHEARRHPRYSFIPTWLAVKPSDS